MAAECKEVTPPFMADVREVKTVLGWSKLTLKRIVSLKPVRIAKWLSALRSAALSSMHSYIRKDKVWAAVKTCGMVCLKALGGHLVTPVRLRANQLHA